MNSVQNIMVNPETDFRSDTVTKPTPGMMEAMMRASVGDDVFREDPTVNRLEAITAAMFGMEAALYCVSGTMSNQIAISCHAQPGDEVICDQDAHVFYYEGGGIARNAGAQVRVLQGDRGRLNAAQVLSVINPDDVHKARTSLVCLENTCNRGGGACYELEDIAAIRQVCDEHGLSLHLDGARLFNSLVAKKQTVQQFGKLFHSISVCLNKGLGCPSGSMLIGSHAFIKKALRVRKVFGGGLRQAGFMAATAIYALEHQVDRLAEDHEAARMLAAALEKAPWVERLMPVETNIVIAECRDAARVPEIVAALRAEQIGVIAMSPLKIRFVTHLGISAGGLEKAVQVIAGL